jgi:hypothetical protein
MRTVIPDKPVYSFEGGFLLISDSRQQHRIRGWDTPRAQRRLWHNKWEHHEPEFRLVSRSRRRRPEPKAERQMLLPLPADGLASPRRLASGSCSGLDSYAVDQGRKWR